MSVRLWAIQAEITGHRGQISHVQRGYDARTTEGDAVNDETMEKPAGDSDESEKRIELTPEQTEALRSSMASIQQSLNSQFKLPAFTLPESAFKNIIAISGIVQAQRALVADAIKPMLDAQAAWKKEISGSIASDVFKTTVLAQSNLGRIAEQLTKNLDLGGIADSLTAVSRITSTFAEQQSALFKNLGPAIAAMRVSFYPPNLRAIEGLKFADVEVVVMVEGIPLYGLPRTATAVALIRAGGASERRRILGGRWRTISADCRTVVLGCASGAVAPYVPFAVAALDALDAGHTAAAQALAGSLVDAIVTAYFGKDRHRYTPDRNGKRTKDAYDEFNIRQFVAFAPMWQAYQQFFVANGDKVPATFSRNATAHTVSPRQFNRRNAVQGLMLACSLLYRLDEEAASLEAEA
ncbi:hypothetical protein O7602_23670 [Micromonospora sp. WMMD1128]|uniref:hypothetical protein n=1 Tax=Micromonospora sp. WMMD1128 TaxID=3015150 RepID=UPI00248AEF3A|nr:hypothetical protein [Micromonospora sp. WMMD1128]WBB72675.1 hypothetical protein O7602_23670 [Micromonospora sp. WMMD1128]